MTDAVHGQVRTDDTVAPHRWIRYGETDPETGEDVGTWNHWCVDGDTDHHIEPCDEHPDVSGMAIARFA